MEFVALGAVLLLVGIGAIWLVQRRSASGADIRPDIGAEIGGYGEERWRREINMWRGTLRRLERRAEHYDELPAHLQRQIEDARQRIARAQQALSDDASNQ